MASVDDQAEVPGLVVRKGTLTAEDIPNIENIGGEPHERKDVDGIPITPQMAAEVTSAEARAGHDTGKGSVAARVQSAAAYNVREGIVPPVGSADVGTDRGVVDSKADQRRCYNYIQLGAKSHTTQL